MKMLIFSLRILHSIFFVICSFKGFCLLQKENSASEIFFFHTEQRTLQKSDNCQSTQNLSANTFTNVCFSMFIFYTCTQNCVDA